jgi:uncharacterized membrane protein
MSQRRRARKIPIRYDDGFRVAIASLIALPGEAAFLLPMVLRGETIAMPLLVGALCAFMSLYGIVYLLWTHLLFTRAPREEVRRIAALQHHRTPSLASRFFGAGGEMDWAVSAASVSLVAAVLAVLSGGSSGVWLPALVLLTTAVSWVTVVYAFALRYLRLDAAGERISFEIEEEPVFIDFVSMSVMVSSVGAMSAGTPRTRAGLNVVRTHTFLSFAFNTLVVAMIVSLLTGFVNGVA